MHPTNYMPVRTVFFLLVILSSVAALGLASPHALSQGSQPIFGYAWSDTIGWIDLNCANSGVCASNPFALSVDSSGAVTGDAWSENVGWVSANATDLAGCPSAPCSATLSSSYFAGWLKALSGSSAQSGGWDGFINLSGPNYGVTQTGSAFSGFAWGDMVVGWVDFSLASSVLKCAPTLSCVGNSIHNSCSGQDVPCPPTELCVAGACIQCMPTFSCVGNAVHNSCSGKDVPCPPTEFCVAGACIPPNPPPSPVVSIRLSPTLVRSGGMTQVIWSTTNVASCSVSENNPSINDSWTGLSDNQTSSPINHQTIYKLSCTGTDGSTITSTATVNIIPVFQEPCPTGYVRINSKCVLQ